MIIDEYYDKCKKIIEVDKSKAWYYYLHFYRSCLDVEKYLAVYRNEDEILGYFAFAIIYYYCIDNIDFSFDGQFIGNKDIVRGILDRLYLFIKLNEVSFDEFDHQFELCSRNYTPHLFPA